jgi:DNA-directed DNA polymerase III PolC
MLDFVHLHVHSCYSFHEGTDFPAALAARAARLGCRALALTDTNGLYGAVPFVKAARQEGITPLLGVMLDGGREDGPRALVLGRGKAGYAALCRLVTKRHLEWVRNCGPLTPALSPQAERGGQPSPTAALENLVAGLAKEQERIIVLASSSSLLRSLSERLPCGGLYGELVYTGDDVSGRRCREILETCRQLKRPAAATNAVRFADSHSFEVHRVLRAIGGKSTIWKTSRLAHPSCSLKSPEQMRDLFSRHPEALANTLRIASECAAELDLGSWKFPSLRLKKGETPFSALWKRSFEGLKSRYRPLTQEVVARLRSELEVIEDKGFSPYFLVVDDIVRQARKWGMRTVGRGSAACSLVSHCLGVTHVDPIALRLHFERFLNPGRSSPPDIDLDFSWKDRDRILEYVYETYGEERVAMICTHVTFAARSAVRETGKAFGLSDSELGKFTKRIPHYGVHSLTRLAEEVPECRGLPVNQEPYRTILALGEKLAGLPRHLSIHAGGIVVSPGPITDLVPLERASKGLVVTQYDMGPVEDLGLIKIDLLSQRALGVLADAAAAVERTTGKPPPVDDRQAVLGDDATRRLIREGRTMGCFYIESPAMRSLLRKLGTDTFEDLTAASSVIRPGVAESGMMQEYISRHLEARSPSPRPSPPEGGEGERGGPSPSPRVRGEGRGEGSWYLHPLLEEVLEETHGVMIYQEDVLRVAHVLAGMSLGEADSLRRSMSGKMRSAEAMALVRDRFLAGCDGKDVPAAVAREVWRQIESFAGYAFCKAHSASYALLSFQVSWLKAHYPAEFMAAVISNGGGFYSAAAYVSEARRLGLKILLPDVNRSESDCAGSARELRLGLDAIGGLNSASIGSLLESRRREGSFTSLSDLMTRTSLERNELETLIRCGGCDGFELTRPEMLWRLACRPARPPHYSPSPRPRGEGRGEGPGDLDLFPNAGGLDDLVPRLPEYPLEERCRIEEEVFGFPVSRHPLELLPPHLFRGVTSARDMAGMAGRRIRMLGRAIACKRVPVRKRGQREWMKFLSLEDLTGTFEAILFPKCYRRYAEHTLTAGPYLLNGRVEEDHGVCSLNVDRLEVTDPRVCA